MIPYIVETAGRWFGVTEPGVLLMAQGFLLVLFIYWLAQFVLFVLAMIVHLYNRET